MTKPGIPQGTRDFGAETVYKRNFILQAITSTFKLYGFEPLETPAMENLETLMGKYGEEGDKLIFKILNNGLNDEKNKTKAEAGFAKLQQGKHSSELTERALKYDLTIPFARYVAMNHGQLTLPYKRYQVQPVWRADRPQRGRYREFTQCDADVVGSTSILNEIELANIYQDALQKMGMQGHVIKINNRKILAALAEKTGGQKQLTNITVAIDKLDKIGGEKVSEELRTKGLQEDDIKIIEQYLAIDGSNAEKIEAAKVMLAGQPLAVEGIDELVEITNACAGLPLVIDLKLARGLNYYTGTIFEVAAPPQVKIGSIGGGGRYDDLTGLFGVPNIPGVGISFGVDRIFDVMEELDLFPKQITEGPRALFFNLGKLEAALAFAEVQKLRHSGIACELYHAQVKLDKQFKYAEKKGIPYVVIIGSQEMETGMATIKHLPTGRQQNVDLKLIAATLQQS